MEYCIWNTQKVFLIYTKNANIINLFPYCYGLNVCIPAAPPPHAYVKVLTPDVIDGAFGDSACEK